MTIYPSELEAMQEADDLLHAICRAAGVFLNDVQRERAQAELEIRLAALRRRWRTLDLEQERRADDDR